MQLSQSFGEVSTMTIRIVHVYISYYGVKSHKPLSSDLHVILNANVSKELFPLKLRQ